MKHIALPHPLAALQGAWVRRADRSRTPVWIAVATAAPAALGRAVPATPIRSARPQNVTLPARPHAAAAPDACASAVSRWERRPASWIEGLTLALLIAFFGSGLIAVLVGL